MYSNMFDFNYFIYLLNRTQNGKKKFLKSIKSYHNGKAMK